jgi:hypothetical protein
LVIVQNLILVKARECILRNNRTEALALLRSAIQEGTIAPRDGVELMLAMRRASEAIVLEAIDAMQWNKSGAYRFIPRAEHAFA